MLIHSTINLEFVLIAYITDLLFGEFNFIKHPVIIMGDYIKWFEKHFYNNSVLVGGLLTFSLITIVFTVTYFINIFLQQLTYITVSVFELSDNNKIIYHISSLLIGIISSTTISSKMLYNSIKDIIDNPQKIKYIVSRDTDNISKSDINKAAIESYAENISDGIIAPIFYLILFGLPGAFIYKSINTLDSMVGYKNQRYEKFGKISAITDDIANYIPARITALLISILMNSKNALVNFYQYGKKHESPNAGLPISAMAFAINIKLGGNTSYFGEIKHKAYFGNGKENITIDDIKKSLTLQKRLDAFIITFILLLIIFSSH